MPLADFTESDWREMEQVAQRFMAANRVSLMVGLILVPLLFGGIGAAMWAVIPEPFGKIIGYSLFGAGAIVFVFLLWYRQRSQGRPPFVADATVVQWIIRQGRQGQRAYAVEATLHEAHPLGQGGPGSPIQSLTDQTKKLRLTSSKLHGLAPQGSRVFLVCMPTEEVVAVRHADRLTTA